MDKEVLNEVDKFENETKNLPGVSIVDTENISKKEISSKLENEKKNLNSIADKYKELTDLLSDFHVSDINVQ